MIRAFAGALILLCLSASAQEPSQYSPDRQITRENVTSLEVAWTYRTGEPTTPLPGRGKPPAFEATPIYADGLLYIGTPYGHAIAIEPATGKQRWSFDAEIDRKGNYGDFANRGVSTWLDPDAEEGGPCRRRIFFASIDARLFALDAATGKLCAGFGENGRIDLTQGLRRGPEYVGEYQQTSPPAVIDGLVIVGSAIADNSRSNSPSGEVRAFDARTGRLRWTFDPLPDNPDAGAANAWSRIVVDAGRHLVFVPTGSASPDYYGGLRPGDDKYANSVVALESATGKVVWSFQTVHHDVWDYDVATPPALFTTKDAAGVAVGSKTGHLFLLDRATGEPIFPVEERRVPKSDAEGERLSATQPFPTLPAPLVPQSLKPEDVWGPTEADREACRAKIAALRNEGIFTPPSERGSLIIPGNVGGLHWGGVAYDPDRSLLITPTNRIPAVITLVPADQFESYKKAHPDQETTRQRGAPFAMSRILLRGPSGLPCNPPPFGALTAIDANTGKVRWEVPLGRMPAPNVPAEWGSINLGGPLATAGGLVFIGASFDPAIRAFDAESGKELWKGDLPASARSVPMSFTAPDGKQYVVVAAGGHVPEFGPIDNALVAFRLP